jgi:VWFA-related protein
VFKHCHWNEWMRLAVIAIIACLLLGIPLQGTAQNSGNQNKGQTLPDAPAPNNPRPGGQVSPGGPPSVPTQTPDLGDLSIETQSHGTTEGSENNPPPPMPPIKTVPAGSAPAPSNTSQEELYKYVVNTNFVVVPVTVKDPSGHLVEGLLQRDFSIYEDNKPQTVRYFTSDPFALSAAIVLDLSLPNNVVSKVNETLPALVGAFSQYDEVALYTYAGSVQKVQDFIGGTSDRFAQVMKQVRVEAQGRAGGVPVVAGPMAAGPSVNGHPMDAGTPPVEARTYQPEPHVLNDAILAAALDLSRRGPLRRKVIFVISDGRELDSNASYRDVLKVLQTYQILVYGVAVGGGAIPGYRQLEKIKLPGQGYGDILSRYAAATGGQVIPALSPDTIEAAYQRLTSEARNQYTLGYTTVAAVAGNCHEIEVRVKRPGLQVISKPQYCPLPPAAAKKQPGGQ